MAILSSVVFFPCVDIEETGRFYTDICGLTVAQEQAGGKLLIFDTGYGYLGFCQYDDGRPIPTGSCISFNCENEADVDAHYEQVRAKGAKILTPPTRNAGFPVYSCFISDPSGYRVEFQKILLADQELTGGR